MAEKGEAYRLKNLLVTKVDFVDAGANQRANIKLLKRAPEPPEEKGDTAKAILGFITGVAKKWGLPGYWQQDAEEPEPVTKDARTFNQAMERERKAEIFREVWRVTSALEESLASILADDEVTDKASTMKQSVDEFAAFAKQAVDKWCTGQTAGITKKAGDGAPKKTPAKVKDAPGPGDPDPEQDENGTPTGTTPKKDDNKKKTPGQKGVQKEEPEMKIDKSLLNDAEKAFLSEIEKKAGIADDGAKGEPAPEPTQKKAPEPVLPESLLQVMERIDKRLADAEAEQLTEVAKKYELLGVKAEEIMPILKSAQEHPETFAPILKRMDSALAAMEKSGIFAEVGKRGSLNTEATDAQEAWAQIEKKAEEIRKSRPELNVYQARDLACKDNPELAAMLS